MQFFHDFTAPLWELFCGNLLLLVCSGFYLAWWAVRFRPGASGGAGGGVFLAFAFITGIAALLLMSFGVYALSDASKGPAVRLILLGTAVLYVALLLVTSLLFHRQVTSELLIILIWAALELSATAVLYGTGRFGAGIATTLSVLVGLAVAAGLVCYVLYYRLGAAAGYVDGMVPLASNAFVMAVFLGALALS